MSKIRDLGIPFNPALPLCGDFKITRSTDEVACRVLALIPCILRAFDHPLGQVLDWVESESIWELMLDDEQDFLRTKHPDQRSIWDHQWHLESVRMLLWCGRHVDEFEPMAPISQSHWDSVYAIRGSDAKSFMRTTRFREETKLLETLDFFYCLHWAHRDSCISGEEMPSALQHSEVIERRKALEWLFDDEQRDWNNIQLDT